jgi:phospho-N-acetylmuramoyl-pentapeptide-transferase
LLYWLLYEKLFPFFHPFRIFRYLTFRTAFASGTALLIALFIGPWVIQKLHEFQIGQYVREDGPQSHQKKSGTPTMGGVLIAIAILLPTVLWSDPANPFVWITVFSTLAFGAIGFADDYIKVVKRRSLGLTARAKLFWQGLAGASVAIALVVMQQFKHFSTQLTVPFLKSWHPDLLWTWWPSTVPHLGLLAFLPFVVFITLVLVFSSNAVNLTPPLSLCLRTSAATSSLPTILNCSACPWWPNLPSSAAPWWALRSAFSGTTRTRRKSSWETWARWPSVAPSARWP